MRRYKRAHIPNEEGFEFIAILNNGEEIKSIVKRNKNGTHYVERFSEIKEWKRIY